ncbi:hypothetical protein EVAR_71083_1 [Eumeta japonica]|uniref:Uncharacterized protein n=1 Tax=Eumeta variegata TaxID=151549 RepID=A0A4C2A9M0_EUMVA|nr:hypothetical protein EVAR_71083_1 [Eumeta japonica]
MAKPNTTPGPANWRATMPATRYIPVPTHDPTPREVKSRVVRHRCEQNRKMGTGSTVESLPELILGNRIASIGKGREGAIFLAGE